MMATVRHVTFSLGLRKFQTDGFLFVGVYIIYYKKKNMLIIVGKIDQCNVIHNLG